MTDHNYESGRLNLPFVGISTFAKKTYQGDWDNIEADVAILGAPYDFGTQFRAGARFGPRGVREASTLFSFGQLKVQWAQLEHGALLLSLLFLYYLYTVLKCL